MSKRGQKKVFHSFREYKEHFFPKQTAKEDEEEKEKEYRKKCQPTSTNVPGADEK